MHFDSLVQLFWQKYVMYHQGVFPFLCVRWVGALRERARARAMHWTETKP
jgi:hypothetical protein